LTPKSKWLSSTKYRQVCKQSRGAPLALPPFVLGTWLPTLDDARATLPQV